MNLLIQLRWVMLGAALLASGIFAVPLMLPMFPQVVPVGLGLPPEAVFGTAIALQGAGTVAMGRRFRARGVLGGWMAAVSYLAVLVLIIVLASVFVGSAAGPGGLGVGLLVTIPGAILGFALQAIAALGFLLLERRAR